MISTEVREFAKENPELVQKGQNQMREVLERSATDWEFRQKLLSNPREAIAEHTDQDLENVPETVDLVFVESEADATVVLPDPVDPEAELGEDELEVVAGGEVGVSTGTLLACAAAGVGIGAGAAALYDKFSE